MKHRKKSKVPHMTLEEFFVEYKKLFKLGWLAYWGKIPKGKTLRPIWLAPPSGVVYRIPHYERIWIFDPITAVCAVKTGEVFSIVVPRNAARCLGLSRPDRECLINESDGITSRDVRARIIALSKFGKTYT